LVEDGYELYWNGAMLGGSGRLGLHPRVVGTRPLRFVLPADAAGTRGMLAIRTYMLPGSAASRDGGGMHSPPILAPQATGAALHRGTMGKDHRGLRRRRDRADRHAGAHRPGARCWRRSRRKRFLAFACIALALTAARRLNNAIVAWTDLQSLTTYASLASVMWVPTMVAWALAWNRWCMRFAAKHRCAGRRAGELSDSSAS
jgi:hypothetical protein